jgi:hypothetical protein
VPDNPTEEEIEATQVALREGLERAHELVCEAKETMRSHEEAVPPPPNPDVDDIADVG